MFGGCYKFMNVVCVTRVSIYYENNQQDLSNNALNIYGMLYCR